MLHCNQAGYPNVHDFSAIHSDTPLDPARFGARGVRLSQLALLGLPVPEGIILSAGAVQRAVDGEMPDLPDGLKGGLLSLRASPQEPEWGGPTAILNIGICDAALPELTTKIGETGAYTLYRRFIHSFASNVMGVDPEAFEEQQGDSANRIADCKARYLEETETEFPQDPAEQLRLTLHHMAKAWNRPSARILREAKGAAKDAGVALIIQRMALGIGQGVCGSGVVQMVDDTTGAPRLWGRYLPQSQGQDALIGARKTMPVTGAESLENLCPDILPELEKINQTARQLGEAFLFEFTVENSVVSILDASPAKRNARAAVRIAVDLAQAGIISHKDALLRIEPRSLIEHLHPQISQGAARDVFGTGLPASPGAAVGRVVFTPQAAMASHARGEACILVRTETSPEDVRGMHAAVAVLTARGGMTSHAAVIARGLGLPCVVGAADLRMDSLAKTIVSNDGRVFAEGAMICVDGTSGQVISGAPVMNAAVLDDAYETLMQWADDSRTIGVRANADTPDDARMAREFKVDGIGLCRTEHMFFDDDRINVMRKMILSEDVISRRAALKLLLPMQRADFVELFEIMRGLPVTIRLLDPPLHEFLPRSHAGMQGLADAMGLPVETVTARAAEMAEVNPMLGKRGVRLGVTMPEIYEMQARAIFEATAQVNQSGSAVVPEIMIPLVSANREVELVKSRIQAVADQVESELGSAPAYRLGVMVETPRAALRAGDLAQSSEFLSFGTNDLTQMTYGLSRDDAGRFMREYVQQGVFVEDPFHSLDVEGVGELLLMAASRGRAANPGITLGLCGEHGGDPASVQFCKVAGFDYVSCSPFRVPIARLAAAQASIIVEAQGQAANQKEA